MRRRKTKTLKVKKKAPKTRRDSEDPPSRDEEQNTPEPPQEAGATGSGSADTSIGSSSPKRSLTPPPPSVFDTPRKASCVSQGTTSEDQPGSSGESYNQPSTSQEAGGSGSKSPETSMTFSSPRKSLTPPSFRLFDVSRKSSTVSKATTTETQTGSGSEGYHHLGHSPARSLKDGFKKAKVFAAKFVRQLRARSKSPQASGRTAYVFTPKVPGLNDEEVRETLAEIYDKLRSANLSKKLKEGKAVYLKPKEPGDTKPPCGAEVVCIDFESDEEDSIGAGPMVAPDSGLSASSTSTDPNLATSASQHFYLSAVSPESVKRRHASPSERGRETSFSLAETDRSESEATVRLRRGAKKTCQSPRKSADDDSLSSLTSSTRALPLTDIEVISSDQASGSKAGDQESKEGATTEGPGTRSPSRESTRPEEPERLAPQPSRYIQDSEQPSCSHWHSTVELNEYRVAAPEEPSSTASTPSSETMEAIRRRYEEYLRNIPQPRPTNPNDFVSSMRDFLSVHLRNEIVRAGARFICVGSYSIWMVIQDTCADYWFHCGASCENSVQRKPRKPRNINQCRLCCGDLGSSVDSGETDSASSNYLSVDTPMTLSLSPVKLDGSKTPDADRKKPAKAKVSPKKPRKPDESELSPDRPSRPEESTDSTASTSQALSGPSTSGGSRVMARISILIRVEPPPLKPRSPYAHFYPPE